MEIISNVIHVSVLIIYLFILRIGIKYINEKIMKIETKALLISGMIILISSLVLILPISDGIQNSFAKGGLTVAILLVTFVGWLKIVKKLNSPLYRKSVRLLEKLLKDYLV